MCVGLVASSTEEMAAQSIAYHAHGTADGDKYCCYPWLVCHDIKSAMHPLLAQAHPRMINHLTSNLLQCFQALVHSQSITQCSGPRISNSIPIKTVEENTPELVQVVYALGNQTVSH